MGLEKFDDFIGRRRRLGAGNAHGALVNVFVVVEIDFLDGLDLDRPRAVHLDRDALDRRIELDAVERDLVRADTDGALRARDAAGDAPKESRGLGVSARARELAAGGAEHDAVDLAVEEEVDRKGDRAAVGARPARSDGAIHDELGVEVKERRVRARAAADGNRDVRPRIGIAEGEFHRPEHDVLVDRARFRGGDARCAVGHDGRVAEEILAPGESERRLDGRGLHRYERADGLHLEDVETAPGALETLERRIRDSEEAARPAGELILDDPRPESKARVKRPADEDVGDLHRDLGLRREDRQHKLAVVIHELARGVRERHHNVILRTKDRSDVEDGRRRRNAGARHRSRRRGARNRDAESVDDERRFGLGRPAVVNLAAGVAEALGAEEHDPLVLLAGLEAIELQRPDTGRAAEEDRPEDAIDDKAREHAGGRTPEAEPAGRDLDLKEIGLGVLGKEAVAPDAASVELGAAENARAEDLLEAWDHDGLVHLAALAGANRSRRKLQVGFGALGEVVVAADAAGFGVVSRCRRSSRMSARFHSCKIKKERC